MPPLEQLAQNTCKACGLGITYVRITALNGVAIDEWWSHDSIAEDGHPAQVIA